MIKLLKAGFFRLKKDTIFWLFIFFTVVIAIFSLIRYKIGGDMLLNDAINEFIKYIGLLISIFVSIFVGKEYSQGIIRNKIIVGHSRTSIFLSNLIISIIVSILCELIYILLVFSFGMLLLEKIQISIAQLLMTILDTILIIISFCSIFNFIAMMCSEITITTTICIILFIAMYVAQASASYIAKSPKYGTNTYYENGNAYIISQYPNPNYPGEQKVKIAQIIYLSIPQGQAEEIEDNNLEILQQMPIYSITLIVIVNFFGVYIFSKKELK